MNNVTFAERLQQYMDYFGLTKTSVAEIIQKDVSNVARYLNGSYEAKLDVVKKLCDKYSVDPAWMIGYDVPMFRELKKPAPIKKSELSSIDTGFIDDFNALPKQAQILMKDQIEYISSLSKQ